MALLILLCCFVSLFFSLGIYWPFATSKKEVLLVTVLLFSTLIALITEILSAVQCLNLKSILFAWGIIAVVNLLYLYFHKQQLTGFTAGLKERLSASIRNLNGFEWFLLSGVTVILMLIFIQGLLYPPNNWDSMTYHLARITSWVSHQSVAFYPTPITRQLYEPPFAEYVIMHIDMLNRGDYFSGSVQFFFLLFSIISIVLIMESFGLSHRYKIIAVVLAVTIPEVVLQASSTQNDVVVSFFIITAFYFSIKAIKYSKAKDFLCLGLSIGLGVLTKGTAYLYLAPVIVFLITGLSLKIYRTRNYNYLWFSFIAILVFIGINGGQYGRNYKLSGNFLGVDRQEAGTYANQKMNAGLLLSTIVKNAGLHFSLMYAKPVAGISTRAIYQLHTWAGIDINNPAVNYRNNIYQIQNGITDEDCAPNMIHFILIVVSFFILLWGMIKGEKKTVVIALLITIVTQFTLFCLCLKWQPWNSRLQVPLFLMSVPLIVYAISINNIFSKVVYFILPVIIVYAVLVSLHNTRRPYADSIFNTRYQKYFTANPLVYPEYDAIYKRITQSHEKNIGLVLGVDDWEYPLFKDCFNRAINPVYLEVNNLSKNLAQNSNLPGCIISTTLNRPFIDLNGRRFYNQDLKNKYLFLYK